MKVAYCSRWILIGQQTTCCLLFRHAQIWNLTTATHSLSPSLSFSLYHLLLLSPSVSRSLSLSPSHPLVLPILLALIFYAPPFTPSPSLNISQCALVLFSASLSPPPFSFSLTPSSYLSLLWSATAAAEIERHIYIYFFFLSAFEKQQKAVTIAKWLF